MASAEGCLQPRSPSPPPSPSSCSGAGGSRGCGGNELARGFLDGAGPAAIGAILGSAVTLASALSEGWQFGVLVAAAIALLVVRRGVVETLIGAGAIGVVLALAGVSLP